MMKKSESEIEGEKTEKENLEEIQEIVEKAENAKLSGPRIPEWFLLQCGDNK